MCVSVSVGEYETKAQGLKRGDDNGSIEGDVGFARQFFNK